MTTHSTLLLLVLLPSAECHLTRALSAIRPLFSHIGSIRTAQDGFEDASAKRSLMELGLVRQCRLSPPMTTVIFDECTANGNIEWQEMGWVRSGAIKSKQKSRMLAVPAESGRKVTKVVKAKFPNLSSAHLVLSSRKRPAAPEHTPSDARLQTPRVLRNEAQRTQS